MKSERLLEEIKSKIDIVDFISDYITLKKSGQNYKGLCPFHSEKTPSFMVSQSKQIFHCFGCSTGGDVVSFLMKHDNLSFTEALQYLAKKAGIRTTDFTFQKNEFSEKRNKIIQINEEAMKFFTKNLGGTEAAKSYLMNRGINEESFSKFCLGYAAGERDGLFKHLKKIGYNETLIKDAGLVSSDGKNYRDLFRRRIMFPIFNIRNDLIAFGGRVMDDSLPKYLNIPETDVFKKSETLYAMNLAKDEIRGKEYVIFVEGYLDTIVCHQYGFKNTVAPLGTALTSRHLQKLRSLAHKAVVVFDSDIAGIAAARRSMAILSENDFRSRVLLLPPGEDPDSYLRKKGGDSFKKMLAGSISMTEFLLRTSKADKTETIREVIGIIASMKDMILADEILCELSDRSGIHESVLRSELDKLKSKTVSKTTGETRPAKQISNREEYILLSAIISFPEKAGDILGKLDIDDLRGETIRSIFKKIISLADDYTAASLLDSADETERVIITELSLHPGIDLENVERNILDCLRTLKKWKIEEKRRMAEKTGDVTLLDSLLKEKRKLVKREQ